MNTFIAQFSVVCNDLSMLNTLRPGQNGHRFADDTFKRIFLNENVRISINISLKFVPKRPINNNPALVQIMAWCRLGDKPLSEPMMVSLLTHICVTRPQWVNMLFYRPPIIVCCAVICWHGKCIKEYITTITELACADGNMSSTSDLCFTHSSNCSEDSDSDSDSDKIYST